MWFGRTRSSFEKSRFDPSRDWSAKIEESDLNLNCSIFKISSDDKPEFKFNSLSAFIILQIILWFLYHYLTDFIRLGNF